MRTHWPLIVCSVVLLVPLLGSCTQKEDDLASQDCPGSCTTIQGRFTTAGRREGIANVLLEVVWKNIDHTPFGNGGISRRKATGRTNEEGFYQLTFLMREDEEEGYFVVKYQADAKEYLVPLNHNWFEVDGLTPDTAVTYDYLLPRKAFIELQVANREAIKSSDSFAGDFTYELGVLTPQGGSQRRVVAVSYLAPPESLIEVAADQPVFVQTTKVKDNARSLQSDTLVIAGGQKQVFTVAF